MANTQQAHRRAPAAPVFHPGSDEEEEDEGKEEDWDEHERDAEDRYWSRRGGGWRSEEEPEEEAEEEAVEEEEEEEVDEVDGGDSLGSSYLSDNADGVASDADEKRAARAATPYSGLRHGLTWATRVERDRAAAEAEAKLLDEHLHTDDCSRSRASPATTLSSPGGQPPWEGDDGERDSDAGAARARRRLRASLPPGRPRFARRLLCAVLSPPRRRRGGGGSSSGSDVGTSEDASAAADARWTSSSDCDGDGDDSSPIDGGEMNMHAYCSRYPYQLGPNRECIFFGTGLGSCTHASAPLPRRRLCRARLPSPASDGPPEPWWWANMSEEEAAETAAEAEVVRDALQRVRVAVAFFASAGRWAPRADAPVVLPAGRRIVTYDDI